jgi:hypothetical protein
MTRPAPNNVVQFGPRPPAPLSEAALVTRQLDLAREADLAGRPHVAGLLVGAAYAVCDGLPPGGESGGANVAARTSA